MLGRRKERRKEKKRKIRERIMIYLIEIKEVCTAPPLLISPRYHTLLRHTITAPGNEHSQCANHLGLLYLCVARKLVRNDWSFKANEKKECALHPLIPRTA